MANIIHVSTDEMRETVTKYQAAKSTLREAYERMNRAIGILDTCWKGAAYSMMRQKWVETYSNIVRANERMQDAIDELNKTANLFDENESRQTGTFQALDVGASPFD